VSDVAISLNFCERKDAPGPHGQLEGRSGEPRDDRPFALKRDGRFVTACPPHWRRLQRGRVLLVIARTIASRVVAISREIDPAYRPFICHC
jgi:hypothetical protein